MEKLITNWIRSWSKKERVPYKQWKAVIQSIENDASDVVNLGAGLFKVRMASQSTGKRGGYRALLVFKKDKLAIALYAFKKAKQDNISKEELEYFKKLAKTYGTLTKEAIDKLIKREKLYRLEDKDE